MLHLLPGGNPSALLTIASAQHDASEPPSPCCRMLRRHNNRGSDIAQIVKAVVRAWGVAVAAAVGWTRQTGWQADSCPIWTPAVA